MTPDPSCGHAATPLPGRRVRRGTVLVLGFAGMLLLMLFVVLIGVDRLRATEQRLEQIVDNHMRKIRLATRMHHAARERTVSLQKMILLADPFERDEELMGIHHYGAQFAEARQQLLAMPLSEAEHALLREQAELTNRAVPLQERVAELAIRGQTAQAQQLLVTEALPMQNRVLERLQSLYELQEEAAARAVDAARASGVQARAWLLLLSGAALAFGVFIAWVVIRRTQRAEHSLQQEKERAQVTLHSIGDGVVRTDARGRVEYLNPVAERLTGRTSQSAHGEPLLSVLRLRAEGNPTGSVEDPVARALARDATVTSASDIVLQAHGGVERAVELSAAPIHDADGAIAGAVLVFRDVTEMRTLARELSYQATHDALTGLLNRREFERRAHAMLEQARTSGRQHALCFIDLDLFKVVNDTCGHVAGDELLRQLGLVLRSWTRRNDVLARLGGDEFGVLLEDCPLDEAEALVADLQRAVRELRFLWEDKSFEVAASIGIVPVSAASASLSDLLRTADLACYTAKDAGRNRLHVVRPDDTELAARQSEIDWVQRIRHALDDNRFVLYCQRMAPLAAGAHGERYEVLVRLVDRGGELALPGAFLPVAERYHLMPSIDRWVVAHTLATLRDFAPREPGGFAGFNINLSGQSLSDPGFRDYLVETLAASGLPPRWLCFEITETAAVANLSHATQLMTTLKALGCQFALDDFGSGLSSFAYLKRLPVDYLKIDGAFIRDVLHDRSDHAMVASIHQLAHVFGIQTVAEYVENDEIRAAVQAIGIDFAQGYGIARPALLSDTLRALGTSASGSAAA